MKKVILSAFFILLFVVKLTAQVAVTNPANTTPNLAATYTSLANAITALNAITAISGPVTITLNAGNNQTAPAGGYVIQFSAATTATNTVTINGSNNTITASSALTAGALNDAIFKIIGADFVTLQNFTLQENASNTTTTAASNNMTEWGVALLHASTINGAQNNTIQNNTISLNRSYSNSFGIYSNSAHSATLVTGIELPSNNITGPNNNNKVYGNMISNVNFGISFIGADVQDAGNDIGGSSLATGNTITNWGGQAAATNFRYNSATSYCILINHQVTDNVSYNSITSAAVSGTAVNFIGIRKDYSTAQPGIAVTSVIANNTITMTSGFASGSLTAILSQGLIIAPPGTTLNITDNTISNCAVTANGSTSSITGISNTSVWATLNISSNTMFGTTTKATTLGGFTGIQNTGAVTTAINITNNVLGTPASDLVIYSFGNSDPAIGISNTGAGFSVTININGNTIKGINFLTGGAVQGIVNSAGSNRPVTINNNTIMNLNVTATSSSSNIFGIVNSVNASSLTITDNILRNNSSASNGSSYTGVSNTGVVTGSVSISNNQFGNASGGALTFTNFTSGTVTFINNSTSASTAINNINNNSVDGVSVLGTGAFTGISVSGLAATVNINNNRFGSVTGNFVTFNLGQNNQVSAINHALSNSSATLNIQGNDVTGITHVFGASCNYQFITGSFGTASQTISGNTFTNLTLNTTGNVYFIVRLGGLASGMNWTASNNSIVSSFKKTGAGNNVAFVYANGSSSNGSLSTITGNIFSNITAAASFFYGVYENDGASSTNAASKVITGNTISNVTGPVVFYGIYIDKGASLNCSSNNISNITLASGSSTYGIYIATLLGTGSVSISSNNIASVNNTNGDLTGIYYNSISPSSCNITGNSISAFSHSGAGGGSVNGIQVNNGTNVNVDENVINTLTNSENNAIVNGIRIVTGSTVNVFNNEINSLTATANIISSITMVTGILLSGGTPVTVYNNFIADLTAPGTSSNESVRGISVTSSVPNSNYNLYYNSIYINASSTGANFGTSGVYHADNATATTAALNMINNIVVNTSVANGTGVTAAYRRSNTALTNYAAGSDYNLFYAGTPSATRLIYYDGTNSDQTFPAYQARMVTRDDNSLSLMPSFVSATDLHLTTDNCQIDGKGTPVGTVTSDIDNITRDASIPDIGADEFTPALITSLAGTAGTAVCEYKKIAGSGSSFISNDCRLIATVTPSGASPLDWHVNTCVTLDATQQYFNGEPYVQRHFDVEPIVAPSTSTATIQLYFTDAEFDQYNTNNPAWPKLPTAGAGNTVANRNNVRITQFHGAASTWPSSPGNYPGTREIITPGAANVVWNGLYWTVSFDVTGFSGFYLHTTLTNAPLPIVVNYLNGRKQGSDHLLNWKVTCTSTPRANMELQRSADGRTFNGIYSISADAARCQQPFDHTDTDPLKGMNYYRLKITDADGRVTYSTTVALLNAVKGFDIISIAPNPVVENKFTLNMTSAEAAKMELIIFDMQGRTISRRMVSVIAGYNSLPVDVTSLPAGTFYLKLGADSQQSKTARFVKQ